MEKLTLTQIYKIIFYRYESPFNSSMRAHHIFTAIKLCLLPHSHHYYHPPNSHIILRHTISKYSNVQEPFKNT